MWREDLRAQTDLDDIEPECMAEIPRLRRPHPGGEIARRAAPRLTLRCHGTYWPSVAVGLCVGVVVLMVVLEVLTAKPMPMAGF